MRQLTVLHTLSPCLFIYIPLLHPATSFLLLFFLAMSGFDFVVFDLEHGTGDFAYAQSGLQTLEGTGVFGCLRIAGNDPIHIKKAQGLGPDAVIVPNVDTVEQAKAAIQAFHYHPSGGKRGAGWGAERCGRWGLYKEYPYRSSIDTLLVLMIESPLGISNIEEMSRLEGFDMLIIGPRDMATSKYLAPFCPNYCTRDASSLVICESEYFPRAMPVYIYIYIYMLAPLTR